MQTIINLIKRNVPDHLLSTKGASKRQRLLFRIYLFKITTVVINIIGAILIFICAAGPPFDYILLDKSAASSMFYWRFLLIGLILILLSSTWNRKYRHYLFVPMFFFITTAQFMLTGYLLTPKSGVGTAAYAVFLIPVFTVVAPIAFKKRFFLALLTPTAWFITVYFIIGLNLNVFVYGGVALYTVALMSFLIGHFCFYTLLRTSFIQDRNLRKQKQKTDQLAKHDQLTGLYRRSEFNNKLKKSIKRAKRYEENLSVFMADLDHFKNINDTYGHATGDQVLKKFANMLETLVENTIRKTDLVGRYGGEEFVAAFPQANLNGAKKAANRLRKQVKESQFIDSPQTNLTVSIGIAQFKPSDNIESFIKRADQALYAAKDKRDRVVTYKEADTNK